MILNVNDIDVTNVKHQTALDILREAQQEVRLVILRLLPPINEEIILNVNPNGKLGISIIGGIGSEYFQK